MYRPHTRSCRPGNTLIVTLLMLALLAVVGLAALYNARDLAQNAQIRGQAAPGSDTAFPDDGLTAFNAFLSAFIYDVPDSGTGLLNPLRGHSLMATMYGRQPGATEAWNGAGSISTPVTLPGETNPIPRSFVVNHGIVLGQPIQFHPEYAAPTAVGAAPAGARVPKNAPYTYPDMKDFFLAALCPATGEVLVPSFFRPHVFGSLAPNNPKWGSPAGAFETLRPTRALHPNFPAIPANSDGTYTGDVQNLPGGFGPNYQQKNDSLWMDIGLPPITLANGKRVKPLIAPLVLDLDGRLNVNAHGNTLGTGGAHASGAGIGPWEVSLERGLGIEGRAVVQGRGVPNAAAGTPSGWTFSPSTAGAIPLPNYSAVPWNAQGGAALGSLNLPGSSPANLYSTSPSYSPGGYDATNDPTNFPHHPALFQPSEWPLMGTTLPAYKLADTKYLFGRYGGAPAFHALAQIGGQAPSTLRGPAVLANPNPPNSVPNALRADPAHIHRHLVTPYSYSLDRIGLTNGVGADLLAALGGVDLNRPLTDYRNDWTQPLGPNNMGNRVQADADRQALAWDIFVRLVAASNLTAINPTTGQPVIPTPLPPPLLNGLRELAQTAVNIVDYIDSDDVSTRFQWNISGATPAESVVYGVEKPRLVLNEAYSEILNDHTDPTFTPPPAPLPTPGASSPAYVRFWIELQNPGRVPYPAGNGPLGDGSVRVRFTAADGVPAAYSPYRIEIVRENKVPMASVAALFKSPTAAQEGNITGDPSLVAVPDLIFDFSPADGTPARIVPPADGTAAGGMILCAAHFPDNESFNNPPMGFAPFHPNFAATHPNQTITGLPAVPLVGVPVPGGALSYRINLADAPTVTQHVVLLRRLANPYVPYDPVTNPYITVDMLTNVRTADRLLRLQGQDANRAARTTPAGGGWEPNTPPANAGDPDLRPQSCGKVQPYAAWAQFGTPASPPTFPSSMVLFQEPADLDTRPPQQQGVRHTFLRQNSRAATAPNAPTINATLTALSDTLMVPYDWLVHLDRPLINSSELLHVFIGKPHELTLRFLTPSGGMPNTVQKYERTVQAALVGSLSLPSTDPRHNAYRALEFLRVRPHGHMAAFGGRLAGRVNINTIQDKRVWDALFDPHVWNGFTQADVDRWWNQLIGTRTVTLINRPDAHNSGVPHPTPQPGATIYDFGAATHPLVMGNPPLDRPFLPFGVAHNPAVNGGMGIRDTILRLFPNTNPPYPPNSLPSIAVLPPPLGTATHPYQIAEGLRKVLNSITTVSHCFAVYVTVGYFEVESESNLPLTLPGGQPAKFYQLGREYYREIPGDTRHKFFAIVDRSTVGLDPAALAADPSTVQHAAVHPFFTSLEANAPAGSTKLFFAGSGSIDVNADGMPEPIVNADGEPVPIGRGSVLVVGVGANRSVVTVTNAIYMSLTGLIEADLATPLNRSHYAGECVSNVIPGNPGPQPNFDVNAAAYRAVVPFWSRLP